MAARSPISLRADWSVVPLGEITTKIGSGATPTGGEDSYLPERARYALVRSQNVFDRRFDSAGLAFISDEQASRLQGVVLKPKDLLLNITGDGVTFSRACMVPTDILPACVNQHVAIVRVNQSIADPGYVLSYLTHPLVKSYIESFNAGGSRRAITKGHIESFAIPLPSLPEQRAIARTLGTLDEKLELNRQMSETLERLARALFESAFEKSGGSRMGTFSEVVQLRRDPENPLTSPDTVFAHFSIPAFDERQYPVLERGDSIKSLKSRVPAGAILLSKLNPEIERVWLVDVKAGDRAVCSTEFLVLCPRDPFHRAYVYCLARSPAFRRQIETLVTGTSKSHQRAHADAILRLPVALPPKDAATTFQKAASPLLDRALACRRESKTLAELRDSLLPKLISGELRVCESERIAGVTV